MRLRSAALLSGMSIALLCAGEVLAKEKEQVTVTYVLAPMRPLPPGLNAVAVIDAGVETQGTKEDQREKKWSTMAADMIESMVANSAMRFGGGLKVAQRRLTAQILREQDLKLAGLVEGEAASRAGKLLDVQGLITSRITINIDIQKDSKTTLDWAGILGGLTQGMINGKHHDRRRTPAYTPAPRPRTYVTPQPYAAPRSGRAAQSGRAQRYVDPRTGRIYVIPAPAPAAPVAPRPVAPVYPVSPSPVPTRQPRFGMKEVEEISRHLTVQCSFSMVDAVTGAAIVQYSPPPYQKQDTASPDFLFGRTLDPANLDPVDEFIGELVERATQEFVSMVVPTEVSYTYTLVARHSRGEAGLRALRADDYELAMQHLRAEHAKEPDEHETVFSLGVVSELMGDPQRALDYYRQAAAMEDVDKDELRTYVGAKKRLTEHLGRIARPLPPGTSVPEDAVPAGGGDDSQPGAIELR